MIQKQEDIDLIELLIIIWNGKWLLLALVSLFFMIGVAHLYISGEFTKKPFYQSNINVHINPLIKYNDNPYLNHQSVVFDDFQKTFYSEDIFLDWKEMQDSKILFQSIDYKKFKDGDVYLKDLNELLVSFPDENYFIKISTYQKSLVYEIYSYTKYINEILKSSYINLLNEEIQKIEDRNKTFNLNNPKLASSNFIYEIINLEYYIKLINENNLISIQVPSDPININKPINFISLIGFCVFGLIVGLFYIFTRTAIINRRNI